MLESLRAWATSLTGNDISVIATVLSLIVGFLAWRWPRVPSEAAAAPVSAPDRSRNGLSVRTSFGFLTYNDPPRLGDHQMLFIETANPTNRVFRVENVGILIEGTKYQLVWTYVESMPPVPCVLRETEKVNIWKELHYIGQSLVEAGYTKPIRLRAFVGDSYNTRHFGDPVDCDPLDWAKKG